MITFFFTYAQLRSLNLCIVGYTTRSLQASAMASTGATPEAPQGATPASPQGADDVTAAEATTNPFVGAAADQPFAAPDLEAAAVAAAAAAALAARRAAASQPPDEDDTREVAPLARGRGRGRGTVSLSNPASQPRAFGPRAPQRGRGRAGARVDVNDLTQFPALENFTPAIFAPAVPPAPAAAPQHHHASSYADAAAADLQPLEMKPVPRHVAALIGLTAPAMPLLPKRHAHRYDCEAFVTQAKYDAEDIETLANSEEYWRRAAMFRANRIVVVRGPAMRPWMFLYGIARDPLPTPLAMRTTCMMWSPAKRLEAPPEFAPAGELHVLQGLVQDLEKHATSVQLRYMIGKDGEEKFFEAVGIPATAEWQQHLMGVPLSLVTATDAAALRATVKAPFDGARFRRRWNAFLALRHASDQVLSHIIMNSFDARAFARSAWTATLKKQVTEAEGVKTVYTDVQPRPTPPSVGSVPPTAEVEHAAATALREGERAVFVHARRPYSETAWQALTRILGGRLLRATTTVAAFALTPQRAADVDGALVGDDAVVSATFLG